MFCQVNILLAEMERVRPEVSRHCLAVAHLVKEIANLAAFRTPHEEMEAGALLHDYGKIFWPDALFDKGMSELTAHEIAIISSHPYVSRMLVAMKWPECPKSVLRLIETHHSPGGWFPAQLLAACDVWVACHEDRIYRRKAVSDMETIREMLRVAPKRVVRLVLAVVDISSAPPDLNQVDIARMQA